MRNFKVESDLFSHKPRKYIMSVWEKDGCLMIKLKNQVAVKIPNFETYGLTKEDYEYLYKQVLLETGVVDGEVVD